MNAEIEVKCKIDDADKARAVILKIAKPVKKVHQKDNYYTPAHIDYFAQKPVNDYVRTREQDNTLSFEFHHAVRDVNKKKVLAEEYETLVDNPEILKKILELCCFRKVCIIDKQREYYENDDFEICLDTVEKLGTFLEVEAKKMLGTPEETRQKCIELMKQLSPEFKCHAGSYTKMMLKKEAPLWKRSSSS